MLWMDSDRTLLVQSMFDEKEGHSADDTCGHVSAGVSCCGGGAHLLRLYSCVLSVSDQDNLSHCVNHTRLPECSHPELPCN